MKSINLYRNMKNKKKINLGIEVLRMILTFLIVYIHCNNIISSNNKLYSLIN
jgi:hypothetical protein